MSERSLNPEYAPVAERKMLSLIDVIRRHDVGKFDDILVVGCGTGQEAGIIARAFKANTIGIDIGTEFDFDHQGSAPARLVSMDARDLRFPDASFDLIYSFHVLEHIPEPERALREMARALRPGGRYLIGTPNKSRLVGYVGSAVPLGTKIHWNLVDLLQRLRGRWTNEAGAHAGFTRRELQTLCGSAFGDIPVSITDDYYRTIYDARLIDVIIRLGLSRLVFPCVYVLGRKPTGREPLRPVPVHDGARPVPRAE